MPLHGKHRYFQRHLNRRIALLFALGASLFMLGSVLCLFPALQPGLGLDASSTNTIFFVGSIPFTSAAYLQLFQAANPASRDEGAGGISGGKVFFGWRPADINWLGCSLQFLGTVMFNFNTYDAMQTQQWPDQNLAIWAPDMVGSALFLSSAYLACVECMVSVGAWQLRRLIWWICAVNLLGCVAFMLSAVLSYTPVTGQSEALLHWSLAATLVGATGFLVGGLLLLSEPEEPA